MSAQQSEIPVVVLCKPKAGKDTVRVALPQWGSPSRNQADRNIEAACNAIYAALGGQITFESANKIFNDKIAPLVNQKPIIKEPR